MRARYEAMRDALNATGRPILYCMCEWGVSNPWLYAQRVMPIRQAAEPCVVISFHVKPLASCSQVGNSWRTTQDISASITASWAGILENLDGNTGLARFARAGAWNDADMLEVSAGQPLLLPDAASRVAAWLTVPLSRDSWARQAAPSSPTTRPQPTSRSGPSSRRPSSLEQTCERWTTSRSACSRRPS